MRISHSMLTDITFSLYSSLVKKNLLRLLFAVAVLLILALSWCSFRYACQEQTDILESQLQQQGQELTANISRYEFIPLSLALNNNAIELLNNLHDITLISRLNTQLGNFKSRIGALAIFIVDKYGDILASSDDGHDGSLMGQNVALRPYFQNAQSDSISHYFGMGTTHSISGYYQASGIFQGNKKIGAVVVKVDLQSMLRDSRGSEKIMLLDQNNIVVYSSNKDWLYQSLNKLTTGQTHGGLALQSGRHHAESIRLGDTRYILMQEYLPQLKMSLVRLTPVELIYKRVLPRVSSLVTLMILVAVCLYILTQRLQIVQLRLENQHALKMAYNRLEELVKCRTSELEKKKAQLEAEVHERIQSEKTLKNMQNELIRNEKLAVVGQLSAGLAHEINQPLAALGMMSANAIRFFEMGEFGEAKGNLERIGKLVDYIGRLSNQLRSFSHNNDNVIQNISAGVSIDNAMLLLGHRFEKLDCSFIRHPPEKEPWCLCNGLRLEQVLVNLIGNALEATQEQSWRRFVSARWFKQDNMAVIEIEDNGPGISPDALEHIFEPFFTTKKNHGLGLGLALSTDIIRSFKGTLTAQNTEQGARFTIRLPHSQLNSQAGKNNG